MFLIGGNVKTQPPKSSGLEDTLESFTLPATLTASCLASRTSEDGGHTSDPPAISVGSHSGLSKVPRHRSPTIELTPLSLGYLPTEPFPISVAEESLGMSTPLTTEELTEEPRSLDCKPSTPSSCVALFQEEAAPEACPRLTRLSRGSHSSLTEMVCDYLSSDESSESDRNWERSTTPKALDALIPPSARPSLPSVFLCHAGRIQPVSLEMTENARVFYLDLGLCKDTDIATIVPEEECMAGSLSLYDMEFRTEFKCHVIPWDVPDETKVALYTTTSDTSVSHPPPCLNCDPGCPIGTPSETLIVLDYDDTLFPTSALWFILNSIPKEAHSLKTQHSKMSMLKLFYPTVPRQLEKLDNLITEFLSELVGYGKLVLVTNASLYWIESSLAEFIPKTQAFIRKHDVNFISARDENTESIDDPTTWKTISFNQHFGHLIESQSIRTLVSIGDGIWERNAVLQFHHVPGLQVMSLHMIDGPILSILISQLIFIKSTLPHLLCREDKILDLKLAWDLHSH